VTGKEHKEEVEALKNKRPPVDFSEIQSLEEKYSDRDLVNQCFKAIQSTRKSNRIADTVKRSILESWERYPVESVMAGIKTYVEKRYCDQGKNEKYLLGIIRGNAQQKAPANIPGGKIIKRTGSLLDKVFEKQGFRLV
jgi:hypothetical protein